MSQTFPNIFHLLYKNVRNDRMTPMTTFTQLLRNGHRYTSFLSTNQIVYQNFGKLCFSSLARATSQDGFNDLETVCISKIYEI